MKELSMLPVAFVEIRALTHATEEHEKVMRAVENVTGNEVLSESQVEGQNLEGHFGNPIFLTKIRIEKKSQVKRVLERIFSGLPDFERNFFFASLGEKVEEDGSLYLRLDKQAALSGEIRLTREDSIRVRVKIILPKRQRQELLQALQSSFQAWK